MMLNVRHVTVVATLLCPLHATALGADARGTIGLFTEPTTDAYFRNLVVTHR